ncbi:tyrosine-type recombinase/integrase, partial [Xanthomonas vesicatoria]|uniref:tyrosine-type recombinase/integrase n=1 Tax=Xanthomonas vesicatoria TaxID=56460 RepID=UPI001E286729
MPLSDAAVRNAKPAAKPVRLFDGGGLYVEISPKGAKLWRWKYRFGGKEKRLALGIYPEVGLADARAQHLEARKVLRSGVDPGDKRRIDKLVRADRSQLSFAAVSEELLELHAKKNSALTMKRNARIVEKDLNPYLGYRPIAEVSAPELLAVLRKIEARGAIETAHRARGIASMVFRYAITVGKAERDPAADLFGALETPKVQNFASLTEPTDVAPLLRALWGYEGSPVVRAALKLAPLVFARPGELRSAKWKDIDLAAGEWRYVASKTGTPHIVPLASQAVEV